MIYLMKVFVPSNRDIKDYLNTMCAHELFIYILYNFE